MGRIGVYTLGNDAYADWVLGFLESFRSYNPSTELIFVPYDDRIERIAALAPKYNFTLFQDLELVKRWESIGAALSPGKPSVQKMFRKFAAFDGPFDHFLFLDADIIVLSAVNEWMHRIVASGADFAYFDADFEWVYADPDFRERMKREFDSRGFNAGVFLSRRGFLRPEDFEALIPEREELERMFCNGVADQSYLNYVVDKKKSKIVAGREVVPEFDVGTWAGNVSNLRFGPLPSPVTHKGKVLPFLHFAGFQCLSSIPNVQFFQHYRALAEPTRWKRLWWRSQFALRSR